MQNNKLNYKNIKKNYLFIGNVKLNIGFYNLKIRIKIFRHFIKK